MKRPFYFTWQSIRLAVGIAARWVLGLGTKVYWARACDDTTVTTFTVRTIFTDIQQEPKKPKNPLYRNLEDWRAKILKELIHGLGRR